MAKKEINSSKMYQNKFTKYLLEGNISVVSIAIIMLSLLTLSFLLFLGNKIFLGKIPEYYFGFSGIIFLLILGCCGLIQIVREEASGVFGYPTYGLWAKIQGWILLIISWGSAAFLVIYSINVWPN